MISIKDEIVIYKTTKKNKMPNYQLGKIYKIVSSETDKIYVGSTTHKYLSERLSNHKSIYRSWKDGKRGYVSSFELLNYGDAVIILLEAFPCNNKDDLRAKEQDWINQFKDICINRNKAYTGIHAKNEKERIVKYKKQYYTENTEKVAEYKRIYRAEQIELSRSEKLICSCSGKYTRANKARHNKTKKHQDYYLATLQ